MPQQILTVLRRVPSLSHAPESVLMAIVAGAAVFGLFFIFVVVFIISDFVKIEKKEHKAPDTHRLIMDLQHTLIQEMKGTSKQNALMINLTIIFILITVIGTFVSVMGPKATADLVGKAFKAVYSAVPKLARYIRGLTGK